MTLPLLSGRAAICTAPVPPDNAVRVLGERQSLTNDQWEDLWPGPTASVPLVTEAQSLEIVSAHANNTSGGTGVQALRLGLLNENFAYVEQELALNGTTPVAVPEGPWMRVNVMQAANAGSYGWTQSGAIDLRQAGGGAVWARMLVDTNEHRSAIYTIPKDTLAGLVSASVQMRGRKASTYIEVEAQIREPNKAWKVLATAEFDEVENSAFTAVEDTGSRGEELWDFRIRVKGSGNVERVTCNLLVHEWSTRQ